jgi:NTP pyrophosphatase (non-canonical NTP hydrolase)
MDSITDKIQEILDITQEEAAEVIQVISKMKRFGIGAGYMRDESFETNIHALNGEVGDLLVMLELLQSYGILDPTLINEAKYRKIEKLKKWSKIYE